MSEETNDLIKLREISHITVSSIRQTFIELIKRYPEGDVDMFFEAYLYALLSFGFAASDNIPELKNAILATMDDAERRGMDISKMNKDGQ